MIHRIFYYGQEELENVQKTLTVLHSESKNQLEIPNKKKYEENEFSEIDIYYTPYDMQQVELYLLAPDTKFDPRYMAASQLFNEYFGAGLSSIVFQEIREKKALAYSAYAYYANASDAKDNNYLFGYIGTQHDKLEESLKAMLDLMNEMPQAELQFNSAKEAVVKKLESSRTIGSSVYWAYESAKKRGLDFDVNQQIYEQIQSMTIEDLDKFFNEHIKDKKFSICVIGNKETMDLEALDSMGNLKEMSLEELFGY